jgi:hypothetical protein
MTRHWKATEGEEEEEEEEEKEENKKQMLPIESNQEGVKF